MYVILLIGLIFVAGSFASRITEYFKISNVIGYVLAGVILSIVWPGIREILNDSVLNIFGTIAISIITFLIGGELSFERLKGLPKGTLLMVATQSLVTFALVFAVVFFVLHQNLGLSLILGAIGAATAPATTLMTIRRARATGQFVDKLVPLVALDDAFTVVLINIALAVAVSTENFGSLSTALSMSLWEIFGSLIIGIVIGIAMAYLLKSSKGGDELLYVVLGMIMFGTGLASMMHTSTTMASLFAGITISNMVYGSRKVFSSVERFFPPVYVIFFTLTGVLFSFEVFSKNLLVFAVYFLVRFIGKVIGNKLGIILSGGNSQHGNYLGMAALSQSGLALAAAFAASCMLPQYRAIILSVIIPASLLFEIVSPTLIMFALSKTRGKADN